MIDFNTHRIIRQYNGTNRIKAIQNSHKRINALFFINKAFDNQRLLYLKCQILQKPVSNQTLCYYGIFQTCSNNHGFIVNITFKRHGFTVTAVSPSGRIHHITSSQCHPQDSNSRSTLRQSTLIENC